MAHNIIRTNLPQHLKYQPPIPENKKYRPHLPSPLTLAELAAAVCDAQPMPPVWYWSVEQVGDWVEKSLGLFQYRQCFITNLINGRKLLLVDASALPRINITIFEDMKKITAGVRNLFGIELERYHRSISLPDRYPKTLYLFYRRPTGPKRHFTTHLDFFRMMKMAREKQPPSCHWREMQNYKPIIPGKIIVGLKSEPRKLDKKSSLPIDLIWPIPEPIPTPPKKYDYPLRQGLYILHTVED